MIAGQEGGRAAMPERVSPTDREAMEAAWKAKYGDTWDYADPGETVWFEAGWNAHAKADTSHGPEARLEGYEQALREADDLLRRLSEWDVLSTLPDGSPVTADGPHWQGEIARVRSLLDHTTREGQ